MTARVETEGAQGPVLDDTCPSVDESLQSWDDDGMRAWTGLHAVYRRLTRTLEQELLSRHGIGISGYLLLARLAESAGDVRMSELADVALLSPSRVSRLADQLEAAGRLERRACPSDSRGVCAALTDNGRAFLTEVHATYVETVEREFFGRLPERDVKALARAFTRLA